MKCSRLSCPQKPTFQCICRNEQKQFCQNDLLAHLQDTTTRHDATPLQVQMSQDVIKLILSSLGEIKTEIQQKKKQIFDDFSRCVILIENKGRAVLRNMNDLEKSIDKAINDIKTAPENLGDCNLKKTLNLSIDQAKAECAE